MKENLFEAQYNITKKSKLKRFYESNKILARALVLRPKIIIADEPVSMLDVSIRAEILDLMKNIQKKNNISFIYITHDLATARYFGQRIII